nr:protein phosphatase 2C domain-containing protein [uncultured Oscillibacter sp.]
MKQFLKFAHSVQGANHLRDRKVCQDASRAYENGWMSVISVADGHGSDNYPRTDRGSKFAVDAALEAIKEFAKAVRQEAPQDAINNFAEQNDRLRDLELNILRRWHESVDRDIAAHPFCEGELEKVSEKYREIYCDEKSPRRKKAYGTTLIAICVTEDYWFGLQIGDGKCFAVGWDGACTEPIPWDEDCQGNITTSICDTNAMEEFRSFWDSLWRFSSVATAWMTLTPETMNSTIYTARFFVCSPKRVPKPEWRKSGNSCL